MVVSKAKSIGKHLDNWLIARFVIFSLIVLVLSFVVGYDVYTNVISIPLATVGILLGLIIGFLVGRMYKVDWHQKKKKVIANVDRTGAFIIVAYILLSILRVWLFKQWLHGPLLTAFTFSAITGIMAGRLMFLGLNVRKVLSRIKITNK